MQSVCYGCHKEVSSDNPKNIFEDELIIDCQEGDENKEAASPKRIKLCSGIEILTGHKLCRIDVEPDTLCKPCCDQLESYMNFRARLLSSLNLKANNLVLEKNITNVEKSITETQLTEEKKDSLPKEESDSTDSKVSLTTAVPEDVINVDDNSSGLPDLGNVSNEKCDSNDSFHSSKQNDQENNNLNESENSTDISDIATLKEIPSKIQETDIESDIDVCSGEDDEVLELDIQCRHDETVEIGSSSESDIEVCDYEPTGKRLKNYNGLSPPIFF